MVKTEKSEARSAGTMPAAVDPVVSSDGALGGGRETHPAYAMIGASRCSDSQGARLYGTDFEHHHYVMVTIYGSELNRSLSRDWPFAREEYIRVALSEAQWAAFVSSLNMDDGVACTLEWRNGAAVPSIGRREGRKAQFAGEFRETLARAEAEVAKLRQQVQAANLSGRAKDELLSTLTHLANHLTPNVTFVAKQFAEHVERVTEEAKTEVSAHIQHTLTRAGLQALGAEPPIAFLPSGDDKPEGEKR